MAAGVHDYRWHGPFAGAWERDAHSRVGYVGPDFPGGEGSLLEPGAVLGVETWTGTLTAPGLHSRLPKLTGAVAKTVRAAKGAKSARVTFKVKATDDDGGDLPVSCWPRSGSRFPLGKSIVQCAATDASGNTATRTFTVTVRPRR